MIIILGVTLTIFLLLAIILLIYIIKIARRARNVADKAQHMANNLADISQSVKDSVRPAMITTALVEAFKKLKNGHKNSKTPKKKNGE